MTGANSTLIYGAVIPARFRACVPPGSRADHGEGIYRIDTSGRKYIDFTSGIGVTSTGHAHPKVVKATQDQAARLIHGQANIVYHQPMLELIDELMTIVLWPELDRYFFGNSGTEIVSVVPPLEFMQELRRLCDQHGLLLVADEIQSGMGRTGKFFALEHFGVQPEGLITAKGIASGLPLSALVTRQDLMAKWTPGSHAELMGAMQWPVRRLSQRFKC